MLHVATVGDPDFIRRVPGEGATGGGFDPELTGACAEAVLIFGL
jgi:hypothetical protein